MIYYSPFTKSVSGRLVMISKCRGKTADFLEEKLLDDMLSGGFYPGEKLTTMNLAKRYGVSRTPVREALIRLERKGMLVAIKNAGYEIRTPSLEEIDEMYEIREVLEGLVVFKLASNGASAELLAELRHIIQCRKEAKAGELVSYDKKFHELLCDSCGSATLRELVENYRLLSSFFNTFCFWTRTKTEAVAAKANKDHERIVDAIEMREAKKAQRIMRCHIQESRKILQKFIQKAPAE